MNTDETVKLREILANMNSSETSLEEFYERMEKETGGKLTFSALKGYLDKMYESINKSKIEYNLFKWIEYSYSSK